MTKEQQKILKRLAADWLTWKDREKAANEERLNIEEQIYLVVQGELKETGTNHFGNITITTAFNRVWDQAALAVCAEECPADIFPFSTMFKEDRNGTKWLEANKPNAWENIAAALTLKPKKPAFAVKVET